MEERPGWGRKVAVLTVVIVPFAATIVAMVLLWQRLVTWTDVALLLGLHVLTGMGITIGYHRMLTHRSFKAPGFVRAFFLILGSMQLQGRPVEWAATHFVHHQKADQEGDPHSPLEGLFHAHLGWLFKRGLVTEGPVVDAFRRDPVVNFVDRTAFAWAGLGLLIPFLVGGWTGLLWGGLVRLFIGHHVTWSVNSVCHTFGRRHFDTRDASRNNAVVGVLALGEGWHNNHHAFPDSADHGLAWYQPDVSAWIIRGLEKTGLAWGVRRAPRLRDAARAPGAADAEPTE